MNNILLIAQQSYKEIYKSKILYNVLFLGVAIFLITFVAAEFSYGVSDRVVIDIGLGISSLSIGIIAIFLGANLIQNEIERKTLYMVLSRSVSRASFLLGKVLGLSIIIATNLILLTLIVLGLYLLYEGELSVVILYSVLFIFFEALLLLLVSVTFSLISNKILTILMALSLWFAGHGVDGLKELSMIKRDVFIYWIVDMYSIYMPNFSKFNIKNFIFNESLLSNSFIISSIIYSLVWTSIILIVSCMLFNKKELT